MGSIVRIDRRNARRIETAGHDIRYVPHEGRLDFVGTAHETRYLWAADHLALEGASVLDLGCGSGYGAFVLAEKAASVHAADSCEEAIAFARQLYKKPNLRYSKMNACSPTLVEELSPCTYDIIVSFEVIEHLERYFDYLENVRLLLKENGTFLLSTPNRLQTFNWNSRWNPCHFQEFSPYQLRSILGLFFTRVHLIAQGFGDEAKREAVQKELAHRSAMRELDPVTRIARKTWYRIVRRVRPGVCGPKQVFTYADLVFSEEPSDEVLDRAPWLLALCERPHRPDRR